MIKGVARSTWCRPNAEFDFEVRALPGFDAHRVADELQTYAEAELLPKMRAVKSDTDIRFQPLSAYPGLATSPDSEAARLLAMLSGSTEFGTVAFGTEGGLFEPGRHSHGGVRAGEHGSRAKPDEFVTVEQLRHCDAMLARLAAYLSTAS